MRLIVISLLALFASLILISVGNSFLVTLLGLRFSFQGIDPADIGIVMVCYSAGFVIGALYAENVVRRVGHIRAFSVFAASASIAALMYPIADSLLLWGALRVVGGLSMASLFIIIESWFSAVASNANRAKIFSLYQVAVYCASAVGQLLIGLGSPINQMLLSFAAVLIMAAVIPLSLSRMHSPEIIESTRKIPLLKLLHISPLGVVSAFIVGVFLGSFYALVPLFATLTGLNSEQIAFYMFGAIMAAMLSAWPIGWICDRVQRSYVLLVVSLLAVVACSANTFFLDDSFLWRLVSICACMGLASTIYPIAVAITNDLVDKSQVITASSGLMLSYALGSVLGPLVGSSLMQSYGPGALFHTLSIALTFMVFYTLYRQYRMPPVPLDEQEEFVQTIPDVHVISDIDPRNEEFIDTPIEDLFREPTSDNGESDSEFTDIFPKNNNGLDESRC
ncbi:MAG: MFS transporter [Oceanospirillales bacterium]|nr:MFS transporter [Oceanospirillales bacterium]